MDVRKAQFDCPCKTVVTLTSSQPIHDYFSLLSSLPTFLQRLQEMQTLQEQVEEAERRHSAVEGQVYFG